MFIPAPERAQKDATNAHGHTGHDEHTSFLIPLTHQMGTKCLSKDLALVLRDIVPLI